MYIYTLNMCITLYIYMFVYAYILQFLLRHPLWSLDCLEVCCLVSIQLGIFLLLISTLILLWSKITLCMILHLCNLLKFVFWPRMSICCIFCGYLKRIFSPLLFDGVFCKWARSCWLMRMLSTSIFLWIVFSCCVNWEFIYFSV